jgi:hypothetical protein
MEKTSDLLWRAWSAKFCEIVEAMDHQFTDRDGNDRYLNHFFHRQPNGELLQVITTAASEDVIELNLYGEGGSPTPVGSLAVRYDGEVRMTSSGSGYRFHEGTAPEIVDFLKRMRTKAIAQVSPSSQAKA